MTNLSNAPNCCRLALRLPERVTWVQQPIPFRGVEWHSDLRYRSVKDRHDFAVRGASHARISGGNVRPHGRTRPRRLVSWRLLDRLLDRVRCGDGPANWCL